MYCIKESRVAATPEETISDRQQLYEEILPEWEDLIFKVATKTFPKVDQGLMELGDIRQEIRQAMWEALLAYDASKGASQGTWLHKIICQSGSLIAKSQYHKMPHNEEKHGMQTLPLKATSSGLPDGDGPKDYEIQLIDPDTTGRVNSIELDILIKECIESIRPVMNAGFEQDAFDLLITGMSVGMAATALGTRPARVSQVRLKIKIADAILHDGDPGQVSSAKNVPTLAARIKCLLGEEKRTSISSGLCPQPT
jgi:hypothetical protein